MHREKGKKIIEDFSMKCGIITKANIYVIEIWFRMERVQMVFEGLYTGILLT